MKRIDTHTHPKISKHFAFRPESITRMVSMARRVGLDGIALTEHFHGRAYWVMLLVQARALGLPIVAGSDAHHWLQLGVRHTLVHADAIRLDDVIGAIRRGLTGYGTLPCTALRVRGAKALKRAVKWLHRPASWVGGPHPAHHSALVEAPAAKEVPGI